MKFFLAVFLLALLAIAGVQVYRLYVQNQVLAQEEEKLEADAKALQEENYEVQRDLKYFQQDENLVKEFKSKFNYRKPDESMVILVPDAE